MSAATLSGLQVITLDNHPAPLSGSRSLNSSSGSNVSYGNDCLAQRYLSAFERLGAARFIANLETKVAILRADQRDIPLTINDFEYKNSYVCSPYTAFVSYSKEEMRLLENKLLRFSLGRLVDALGVLLKGASINKMVQINNWMFSTNLYYSDWAPDMVRLTKLLVEKYPDHFLCFRSLNNWKNRALLRSLASAGYSLIASRQIYVFEDLARDWLPHKNVKHDLRLLRHTKYEVTTHDQFADEDFERVSELYEMLYRQKYPHHNPSFTPSFMRLAKEVGLLKFVGLRNERGVLDGVVGLFSVDAVTSAPIVGYDISLEQSLGLYRLLMTLVFEDARTNGFSVNLSSGAASFKRLRGGRPEIEYSAVYSGHLSPFRRAALASLAVPINHIGVPLLQELKL